MGRSVLTIGTGGQRACGRRGGTPGGSWWSCMAITERGASGLQRWRRSKQRPARTTGAAPRMTFSDMERRQVADKLRRGLRTALEIVASADAWIAGRCAVRRLYAY